MKTTYYLAIDIGASSGRHILGWLEGGRLCLEEVHRFENEALDKNSRMTWDTGRLFREIVAGLKRCGEAGKRPASLGIDTWGVDYALLDGGDALLGDTVHYRDHRTDGMDAKVFGIVGEQGLYARTGIQHNIFNTVYQLYAMREQEPDVLSRAASFLMMPEYLHYLLSGRKANEYTNATTTQLVSPVTRDWDWDLIKTLGFPAGMFGEIHMPGHAVGSLRPEVAAEIGYDLDVVLPPSHDTASAILAMPAESDDALYVSSGTWSLMGIERREADCRDECRLNGFTNEGGAFRYCFHKNIMGMWIIQSIRKELPERRTFGEMIDMASENLSFPSTFDVNHRSFLAPRSMIGAIRDFCGQAGLAVPKTEGEVLAAAYNSLARSYAATADGIEKLTGRKYRRIHIMGGGSQDSLMNRLAARFTGKEVYAGPVEATALGNILAQMIRAGGFADFSAARAAVRNSFAIRRVDA